MCLGDAGTYNTLKVLIIVIRGHMVLVAAYLISVGVVGNIADYILIHTSYGFIDYALGLSCAESRAADIQKEAVRSYIPEQNRINILFLKHLYIVLTEFNDILIHLSRKLSRADMCGNLKRCYRYCFYGIVLLHDVPFTMNVFSDFMLIKAAVYISYATFTD